MKATATAPDGVTIAYETAGEGAPILLIHGFASNHRVNWVNPRWVDTLTKAGRRVVALDNRGHGASQKLCAPAEYRTDLMARDAANGNNPHEINRKATQDMAQVLVDDFGYVPDHYITVDPAKFVELVDTLGGIDITLSAPVDGTPDELGSFPGGAQHLDGQRALDLLRILHPAGETNPNVWQKFERQRVVTLGLLAAMLKPANWDKLPQVAKDARQVVVTDLSVNQVLDLLCMVQQSGDNNFESISSGIVNQASDEEVDILDAAAVKALIQEYSSDKK